MRVARQRECDRLLDDGPHARPLLRRQRIGVSMAGVRRRHCATPREATPAPSASREPRFAERCRAPRRLHLAEAGEEAALHDTRQTLVHATKTVERFVERDQRFSTLGNGDRVRVAVLEKLERHGGAPLTAASRGLMLARIVDQDAAHRARRDREELSAIDPLRVCLSGEPHVRLVHDGGGGQRVTTRFGPQLSVRDAFQLAVDQRHELVHRLWSAAP